MSRSQIVNAITPIILEKGFWSMKVDDIVDELKMSKKTFYRYFPSKKKLLVEVFYQRGILLSKVADETMEASVNAIEQYIRTMTSVGVFINYHQQRENLKELHRYYVDLYDNNMNMLRDSIKQIITNILKRGASEELFRYEDVKTQSNYFTETLLAMLTYQGEMYHADKEEFLEYARIFFTNYLHGMLTEKGYKFLMEFRVQIPEILKEYEHYNYADFYNRFNES